MKKFRIHVLLVAFFLSLASSRCSSGANLLKPGSPLLSSLGGIPNLSSLNGLLQTPGLGKVLGESMKDPFTLLAPTNDALNSMGPDSLSNLTKPSNVNQLAGILKNHIVPGKLDAAGLAQPGIKSAGGKGLDLAGANLGNMISGDKFNIIPVDKVMPN